LREPLPKISPVFLFDHQEQDANTVGILPEEGVIAHEYTHVSEHHIFVAMTCACLCSCALASIQTGSNHLFLPGFLAFWRCGATLNTART
jgi:hypothetical protein